MKLYRLLSVLLMFTMCTPSGEVQKDKSLYINENGRCFQAPNGKPFLYLGDTAWELFHKLTREEATEYLENRAEKGFTVIQAVVLAENDGLRTPNPYGEVPFVDLDPTKPNEKYFEHVDFIVDKANELGLFIGMLPTWGDKVFSENPGAGPVIFNKENAAIYGKFLGERYSTDSIIWILGGDRKVANEMVFAIWESMAEGLKTGDNGRHLITFHPRGATNSSWWFHNSNWLDFNMYQSGHEGPFNPVYRYAQRSYLLQPVKPFVDGEPAYEDIAVKFWEFMDFSKPSYQRVPEGVLDDDYLIINKEHFAKGFITAFDVRVYAYWNILSGAAGYTYGNNAIWQMFKKGEEVAIPALFDWRESMNRPGAQDMRHVRDVFESRPLDILLPNQSVIYGENPENSFHIRAASASDNSYLMIYLAQGQPVHVVMNTVRDQTANAWWFDPRSGEAEKIGEFRTENIQLFTPPSSGMNNDWLLVIDAASKNYPAPGIKQ